MKKLFLITALILTIATCAYAYCITDISCMTDCANQGYMYELCKQWCTYCY